MNCSLRDFNLPKGDGVAVNGIRIRREEIARESQNHPARTPIEAWRAAARALVIRELLLQEARRIGIAAGPISDDEGRRETDDESLVRQLVEREIQTPEPDEVSCRRYYEQNRKTFRSLAIYEAAHILFAARQDDAQAFARAREAALVARETLRRDPSRFAEVASALSACSSSRQGGNLGQIVAGQTTPEFEAALFALPVGAISEPIATRYGLHIIRLDRKIEERQLPFELVSSRIAEYLRESVRRRATAQYIARLVSRSRVTGIDLDGTETHRVN